MNKILILTKKGEEQPFAALNFSEEIRHEVQTHPYRPDEWNSYCYMKFYNAIKSEVNEGRSLNHLKTLPCIQTFLSDCLYNSNSKTWDFSVTNFDEDDQLHTVIYQAQKVSLI